MPVVYGLGAVAEIGHHARALDLERVLVVTDRWVAATAVVDDVSASLTEAGVETVVWSGTAVEPTEASVRRGVDELTGERFDGVVAVGGGSAVDTAKLLNLLLACPGELTDFVPAPRGGGRRATGPLPSLIGVPTTSGPGAECTPAAAVDIPGLGGKVSVVDPAMRPALAVVDPLATLDAPPAVTASAGYDALVQSVESYTSRPFDRVPAIPSHRRPPMVGANPLSDPWCERAIELCGRYLARAVHHGHDVEARVGMSQAALFSRLGAAGAHVPHALGAAIAAEARDHRPDGFDGLDRPLVPHGQSVVGAAAEAFAFTHSGAPERHDTAARLLGAPADEIDDGDGRALGRRIRQLVEATGGPVGIAAFGLTEQDVPALARRAAGQGRLLPRSPRPVTEDDLTAILLSGLYGKLR
ncbi:iron-containing alcohol dehydrogenase [Pseudonocardia sp. ICBG1122]|nr:iron-containing alcohol dehydrogenase [Pseudonocardia pini]